MGGSSIVVSGYPVYADHDASRLRQTDSSIIGLIGGVGSGRCEKNCPTEMSPEYLLQREWQQVCLICQVKT